jgi:hypothetical protein
VKIQLPQAKSRAFQMRQDQPSAFNPMPAEDSKAGSKQFAVQILRWNAKHPVLAIVCVSLLAVAINCYPIIFCGKSYVSPVADITLVYDWWPPLPGMEKWHRPMVESQHGSDIGAMMFWGVPMGFVESRSLLEQGELPLWNRYGHAGDTLIGQGVSMLGDPLQLIVILGRGSAIAWDSKFLVAKFLFCLGFGLLVLKLLDSRALSLAYSALAAYCGAYFFINNHPAFFVFTYAPWILLAAIEWLDLQSHWNVRWGLIWLLANFACFNAGHVELAVILIVGLNLAAVIHALMSYHNAVNWAKVLVRMGLGVLFFAGLTAPVWMSFLASLDGSYNIHTKVEVHQLPLTMLPGAFDDLFYLLIRPNDTDDAFAPGTSLLVLAGCSFSVLKWRLLKGDSFFWVNTGAILLWGGCVFGWVPSSLLAMIPLLNRVGHNYADFSYLLVIHLTLQSAYGFKCLAKAENLRQMAIDIAFIGGVFAGIFVLYSFGEAHQPIPWNYFLCASAGAAGSPLLFIFLKSHRQQTLTLGWAGIIILAFIPNFRFGLYHAGNDKLLMLPGSRVTFNNPSQAIERIKKDKSEPFRAVGLGWNLMGDYSAVYELEDIRSCAPLSDGEFINIIRNFPGVKFTSKVGWVIEVVDPIQAQPLLNLLNVKYLLAPPDVEIGGRLDFRITDRSDFLVLENLQAWPRAFFVNQVVSIDSTDAFIKHLLENGQRPFIALAKSKIEKQPGLQSLETTNAATLSPATNYRLSVNSTGFDVHAPSAGMVCLTEGQAKDFTATANGESKEVLTVNRAFKGIYIDKPGDYHIEFTYRPHHWRLACTLFWISICAVFALASADYVHTRNRRKVGNLNIEEQSAA